MLVCFMLLNVIVCSSIWCSYMIWCSGHQLNTRTTVQRLIAGRFHRRDEGVAEVSARRWERPGMEECPFASLDADGCRISADLGVNSRCQVSTYNIYQHLLHRNLYGLWGSVGETGLEHVGKQSRKMQKAYESETILVEVLWSSNVWQKPWTEQQQTRAKNGKETYWEHINTHNIFHDSRLWLQYS